MSKRTRLFKWVLPGAGLVFGLVGGLAASSAVAADSGPDYPVNISGESFGSALLADTPSEVPDLVQAVATNGKIGYVKNSDLTALDPSTPTEALAVDMAPARTIPVFAKDGETQIGDFVVGGGSGSEVSAPVSNN